MADCLCINTQSENAAYRPYLRRPPFGGPRIYLPVSYFRESGTPICPVANELGGTYAVILVTSYYAVGDVVIFRFNCEDPQGPLIHRSIVTGNESRTTDHRLSEQGRAEAAGAEPNDFVGCRRSSAGTPPILGRIDAYLSEGVWTQL